MRSRKVVVTIELTTDASVKSIKEAYSYSPNLLVQLDKLAKVSQVQVNVIKEVKSDN